MRCIENQHHGNVSKMDDTSVSHHATLAGMACGQRAFQYCSFLYFKGMNFMLLRTRIVCATSAAALEHKVRCELQGYRKQSEVPHCYHLSKRSQSRCTGQANFHTHLFLQAGLGIPKALPSRGHADARLAHKSINPATSCDWMFTSLQPLICCQQLSC